MLNKGANVAKQGSIQYHMFPREHTVPNKGALWCRTREHTVPNKGEYGAKQGSIRCRIKENTVLNKGAYSTE